MAAKYIEIEIYKTITYNSYTADRYEISNLGHVRNKITGKILTNIARPHYASVILQIGNGRQKSFYVHVLVARYFLPNPSGLSEMNHRDQNKMNPKLNNLEWCDRRYNMTYGDVVDRIIAGQMNHSPEFICVETGMIYRNQALAARDLGINRSNLNSVLAGQRKTAGGYTFRWLYQIAEGLPHVG